MGRGRIQGNYNSEDRSKNMIFSLRKLPVVLMTLLNMYVEAEMFFIVQVSQLELNSIQMYRCGVSRFCNVVNMETKVHVY
jgi:hypothetical protein